MKIRKIMKIQNDPVSSDLIFRTRASEMNLWTGNCSEIWIRLFFRKYRWWYGPPGNFWECVHFKRLKKRPAVFSLIFLLLIFLLRVLYWILDEIFFFWIWSIILWFGDLSQGWPPDDTPRPGLTTIYMMDIWWNPMDFR